jgi:hypothetical protein
VGASLLFQLLFYVYFFCSFARNYSRNLTLKSYRKRRLSIGHHHAESNAESLDTGTEAAYFTSDEHTVDLPQRNVAPRDLGSRHRTTGQINAGPMKASEPLDRPRMPVSPAT